jgi:hypothetical protein
MLALGSAAGNLLGARVGAARVADAICGEDVGTSVTTTASSLPGA